MIDPTAPRKPLDVSRLTLGEVAKLEDLSGLPMASIGDLTNNPQGKLLAAMIFVNERRNGNSPTWPECLDVPMTDAMAMLGMDEDTPDAEAADEAAPDEAADPLAGVTAGESFPN